MSQCEFTEDPKSPVAGLMLYAEGKHRCIKDTGVYLPPSVSINSNKFNVILCLHGYYVHNVRDLFAPAKASHNTALREGVLASKKNVILVAPWLGHRNQEGGSLGLGELGDADGCKRYLEEVMAGILRYRNAKAKAAAPTGASVGTGATAGAGGGAKAPPVTAKPVTKVDDGPKLEIENLIVVGHSAGGGMMQTVVDKGLGSLKDKLRECWGFDCFYKDWSPWVRSGSLSKIQLYFYVADGSGGGGEWIHKLWNNVLGTLKKPAKPAPPNNLHVALALKVPGTLVDRTAFQSVDDIAKKVAPDPYEKARKALDPLLDGKYPVYWAATRKQLMGHFQIVREGLSYRITQSPSL